MRVARLSGLAAALLATLALTGCEPVNNTGGVGSGGGGIVCDPGGWGPLNDCGDESTGTSKPVDTTEPESTPEPEPVEEPTPGPEPSPSPCDAGEDRHSLRWVFDDNDSCGPDGTEGTEGDPDRHVSVSVTWIVVHIEQTGFRECVLSLRSSEHSSENHYSRVITTKKDCAAQRVNTTYHPVDN